MSKKFNTAKEYKDCFRAYLLSIVPKTDITDINELPASVPNHTKTINNRQ